MISSVRGTVLTAQGNDVVLEVGGVGLSINVTPDCARSMRIGEEQTLRTRLIVREDALTLFGFASSDEVDVFDLLLTVNGVGPKSALGVLSELSPSQVAAAVTDEDDKPFRRVSGIGPKTAKLIVVTLSGKITAIAASEQESSPTAPTKSGTEVILALTGLGWPEKAAEAAVTDMLTSDPEIAAATLQVQLRSALGRLGPARPAEGNR